MNECKSFTPAVKPTKQTVRPEFIGGHIYLLKGSTFEGLDSLYLACNIQGEHSLHSLLDGNCWSTNPDSPFGSDLSTQHIWTDVTSKVCVNTGGVV